MPLRPLAKRKYNIDTTGYLHYACCFQRHSQTMQHFTSFTVTKSSLMWSIFYRALCLQSAAWRRCSTSQNSAGLSSTPNTNPQQPDTGDERSRQACERGVPSRLVCLSACLPSGASNTPCQTPTTASGKINPREIHYLAVCQHSSAS